MLPIRARHSPPLISGQACLVLTYGGALDAPGVGQRFELVGDELIVGRGTDADLLIDRDAVSRRHARLYRREGVWHVCDLQSTNGTYVDDMPVQDHLLHHGEQVKIGTAIFRFLTGQDVEAAYFEEIHRLATTCGLTQVHTRRSLQLVLEGELDRCAHYAHSLSLLILQVDNLKALTDHHGQLVGDYILKELARRVQGLLRREQLLARHAHDAFAAALPEVDEAGAAALAERVRGAVEGATFDFEAERIAVTVSLGVATAPPGGAMGPAALLRMAEERLQRARRRDG